MVKESADELLNSDTSETATSESAKKFPHTTTHLGRVETKDGTTTLFNAQFNQTYHSTTGAYEEAMEKYVRPAKIKKGDTVLDYCFGLGYNTLAAIELAGGMEAGLSIVALENDSKMLFMLGTIKFANSKQQEIYRLLIQPILGAMSQDKTDFHFSVGTNKVRVIVGDAREKLPLFLRTSTRRFDAILFDPFSPKECPQLWTEVVFAECFAALKSVSDGGGVLTTYSCAGNVRRAMTTAGFVVSDGPSVGRRAPSTIARKI